MHTKLRFRHLSSLVLALALSLAGCGGTTEATLDAGTDAGGPGDAGPAVDARTCSTATDCDDGVFCNGIETCVERACAPGPIFCDDDIACTVDSCDESLRTCSFDVPDLDLDGAADAHCLDETGLPLGTDCDDDDPSAFPGNTELCDDHDEDCNPSTVGGSDLDLDGYLPSDCCNPDADGAPTCGLDCDDTRANVSRLASEVCDGIDNDCDGDVDDGVLQMSWPDADLDGFGDESATPEIVCSVPSSRANAGGDCDDTDRRVHPFQTEECNGGDDDCDGTIDEGGTAACAYGLAGTTAECVAGQCVITGCAASRFDCNRIASDGCEPLCSDSANCGECGHVCAAPLTSCGGGHCPGFYATLGTFGTLTDLETGAPIAGATITVLATCTPISATTMADGSWVLNDLTGFPRWVRIEAPGHPTHVQPFDNALVMLPSSLVDAWAVDPDVASPPSAERAILVIEVADGSYEPFVHDGIIGASNEAVGADLLPSGGAGGRRVYFGAVPGRMSVGGSTSDGTGCSTLCGAIRDLWLEPGAVTLVQGVSCAAFCS